MYFLLMLDNHSKMNPLAFSIRAGLCDGAVMVTASHLPSDRNGFKLFSPEGGFTKDKVQQMNRLAADFAQKWHDMEGLLPPTSGGEGVFCSEWVSTVVFPWEWLLHVF